MKDGALRIGAAALVAMVAVWAASRMFLAYRAERVTARQGAAAEATRQDPLAAPALIPERLPQFSLRDLDGRLTPISRWAGRSLVINFWATWCAPCRREIPLLESLRTDDDQTGPAVIGIAVDRREQVATYARELRIDYPLLVGEQDALDAAAAFGVVAPVFPFTVFTDRRGLIVTVYLGELHRPQASLILSVVRDLDADKIALPQARQDIEEGLKALASQRKG